MLPNKSYLQEVFDFFRIITVTFSTNTLHLLDLASFTSSLQHKMVQMMCQLFCCKINTVLNAAIHVYLNVLKMNICLLTEVDNRSQKIEQTYKEQYRFACKAVINYQLKMTGKWSRDQKSFIVI